MKSSRHPPNSKLTAPANPSRGLQPSGNTLPLDDRTQTTGSRAPGGRIPCLFCAKLRGSTRYDIDPLFDEMMCQDMAARMQTNLSATFIAAGAEMGIFTTSCDGSGSSDEIQLCASAKPASVLIPGSVAEALVRDWLRELFSMSFQCAGRGDEYGLVGMLGSADSCIYGSYGVRISCN